MVLVARPADRHAADRGRRADAEPRGLHLGQPPARAKPRRAGLPRVRAAQAGAGRLRAGHLHQRGGRADPRPDQLRPRPAEAPRPTAPPARRAASARGRGLSEAQQEHVRPGGAAHRHAQATRSARSSWRCGSASAACRRSTTRTSCCSSCSSRASAAEVPKPRFAYLFPHNDAALIQARLRPGLSADERRDAMEMVRAGGGGKALRPEVRQLRRVGIPRASRREWRPGSPTRRRRSWRPRSCWWRSRSLLTFRARPVLLPLALGAGATAITLGGLSLLAGPSPWASRPRCRCCAALGAGWALQLLGRLDAAPAVAAGSAGLGARVRGAPDLAGFDGPFVRRCCRDRPDRVVRARAHRRGGRDRRASQLARRFAPIGRRRRSHRRARIAQIGRRFAGGRPTASVARARRRHGAARAAPRALRAAWSGSHSRCRDPRAMADPGGASASPACPRLPCGWQGGVARRACRPGRVLGSRSRCRAGVGGRDPDRRHVGPGPPAADGPRRGPRPGLARARDRHPRRRERDRALGAPARPGGRALDVLLPAAGPAPERLPERAALPRGRAVPGAVADEPVRAGQRRTRARSRQAVAALPPYFSQNVITRDRRTANIAFRIGAMPPQERRGGDRRHAGRARPARRRRGRAGGPPWSTAATGEDDLATSMWLVTLLALVAVALLLAVLSRSLEAALLVAIPPGARGRAGHSWSCSCCRSTSTS